MKKSTTGKLGEMAVARMLREKGFEIVDANYRCRFGEIDVIATDEKYLCFVEVKTRSENALYLPAEAVTSAKRKRIIATAELYLAQYPTALQPRFDVAEVFVKQEKVDKIHYIPNAFEVE